MMKYKMRKGVKEIILSGNEKIKLQNDIFDIMKEFDRVCRRGLIKYSIAGGTLLGSVRHQGFIPWDCDADFMMMREDYEKFKKMCDLCLEKKKYFLQDMETDEEYRWGHARLLRLNTSYIRAGYEKMQAKNGIFVDIFIMDNAPDSGIKKCFYFFSFLIIRKILWSVVGRDVASNMFLRLMYSALYKIKKKHVVSVRELLLHSMNSSDAEKVWHICSPMPGKFKFGMSKSFFESYEEYQFENKKFMGIKASHQFLIGQYGQYMNLPPMKERINHIPCSYIKFTDLNSKGGYDGERSYYCGRNWSSDE